MKLKYIFGSLLSAFLFAGCADDGDTVGTYNNLTYDDTYVTISADGGDATVTLKTNADWKFDDIFSVTATINGEKTTLSYPLPVKLNSDKTAGEYAWLTVDKLSGPAGETTLTFHADATDGGRETELRLSVGDKKQFIRVRQGSMEATPSTCAEIIAGPDSKTYQVTGTVMAIANTTYGNWYLADETGQIYIYGTLDANGATKNFTSLGIEVGDVVTVEGPKTTYNGTVELVDVTVIKIVKSLVKVVTPDATIEKEGGEFSVKVAYKGSGANFTIPAEAQSWLHPTGSTYKAGVKTIYDTAEPADTTIFTFKVDANEGEKREAAIDFSSSNSSSSSTVTFNVKQEGISNPATGSGTKADPYNVTAMLNYVKALGADVKSTDDVYVKGIISSIKYTYSAQYGTATYNISADGKEDNVFTVYGSYYFDNQPWAEGNTQIAVGDEVIVGGKVIYYKGTTPEFSNKESWLVSLNGKTSEGGAEAEKGSVDNPFTVADAISYIDGGGADDVYVQGVVSKIVYAFDAAHGTGTFWISSDGNFNDDATKDFEAYSVYWLDNKAWADGDGQVAVGDKVVLCGKLTKYKTTYETSSKKAYLYSLNGKTK